MTFDPWVLPTIVVIAALLLVLLNLVRDCVKSRPKETSDDTPHLPTRPYEGSSAYDSRDAGENSLEQTSSDEKPHDKEEPRADKVTPAQSTATGDVYLLLNYMVDIRRTTTRHFGLVSMYEIDLAEPMTHAQFCSMMNSYPNGQKLYVTKDSEAAMVRDWRTIQGSGERKTVICHGCSVSTPVKGQIRNSHDPIAGVGHNIVLHTSQIMGWYPAIAWLRFDPDTLELVESDSRVSVCFTSNADLAEGSWFSPNSFINPNKDQDHGPSTAEQPASDD